MTGEKVYVLDSIKARLPYWERRVNELLADGVFMEYAVTDNIDIEKGEFLSFFGPCRVLTLTEGDPLQHKGYKYE